ncbi:MAG: hypothetical protein IV100_10640, partial [Myxococcales bacterium]|nr:hypothetical protein [Myxococcales bacterium]
NDFELTKDYVPFAIALETAADVATVTMSRTSEIEVAITTPEDARGPRRTRYLTLGLLGDGQQPIDAIRVLVDGRPIALEILVVERHDRPTKPVLVSNHPWSYELIEDPESRSEDGRRLVLVPKAWPAVSCPGPGGDDSGIVIGPDGILDRREAHWRPAMVVRRVSDFPPRDESRCDALRLDRQGPGERRGPDEHRGPDDDIPRRDGGR